MSDREEVLLERGFILHHRPYRNTSLLIDCLTANHGRVGLVAQGARRQRTGNKALIQPFVPLKLSWVRRRELGRLTNVEADHAFLPLSGDALLAGFYVNELLLRLVSGGDASDDVFSCYSRCLVELADSGNVARSLRFFELSLLDALGYRVELEHDVETGEPIQADLMYTFVLESGPTLSMARPGDDQFAGEHLISLRDRVLGDQESLRASKHLLRRILRAYLGERPLKSREVMKDLVEGGFGK